MAVYLGQKTPGFIVNTIERQLNLENYEGKWTVPFSHPANFTPACTTELMEFARRYDEFKKLNIDRPIRSVKALQMNWNKKLAAPVNWQPDHDRIVSAPGTSEETVVGRKNGSKNWYLKYKVVK
jgi:alkyl hydroperoxide reductase subunit AhpC